MGAQTQWNVHTQRGISSIGKLPESTKRSPLEHNMEIQALAKSLHVS
jgi:hypothetical protein